MNIRRMHFLLVSVFFALGGLGSNAKAEVAVVIELIPDNPGPYAGGEVLTVDVWLHSQVAFDASLDTVQLDFSDSDPELALDPTFTFDLSAIPVDRGYDYATLPELPVPVVWVVHDGPIFPENMLPLAAGGSLHIGSLGLQLPTNTAVYRLDALNSDEPSDVLGARIDVSFPPVGRLRAFTGEITGGNLAFVVGNPPIPAVSVWGLVVMVLLVLVVGSVTIMRRKHSITRNMLVVALLALGLGQPSALAQNPGGGGALSVRQTDGSFELTLDNAAPFHVTQREVTNTRLVDVADSTVRVALWDEVTPAGETVPFYGVSLDGMNMDRITATSYDLRLRYARFDPTISSPAVETSLQGDANSSLYIVQFITQPLQAYRKPIQQLGGTIYNFLGNHAHIVKMDPACRTQVEALPFVRSVVRFHPAYRLEEFMRDNLDRSAELFPLLRYNIQVFEAGPHQKNSVAARIEALGGTVNVANAGKFLLQATLTPQQLLEVVGWDEVSFVDRWGPYEPDMNEARAISGANFLENATGFTGQGVRGEVFDSGFNRDHQDLKAVEGGRIKLIPHGPVGLHEHGASTSGIVFGDGLGNWDARGLLPDGQGIVANYNFIGVTGLSRYCHTCELVKGGEGSQDPCPDECQPVDAGAPYEAVFQTFSSGSARTTEYTPISADLDAALFDFDVLLCQSQSNKGHTSFPQDSRPEAWAKNVVSVGGIKHVNTADRSDDAWCEGPSPCSIWCASIGPAADGRIKPDLAHFYDCIDTIACCEPSRAPCSSCEDDIYTDSFFGTSAATPITCGYFGLMFQMWHEEVFCEFGGKATVFESRPHMATAKALMINTAYHYDFSGSEHDLTRVHQGWGMVDVENLYELRDKMFIINETDLLSNMQSVAYPVVVAPGEPELRVTLVYTDPPGSPTPADSRVNDLTLRVTSPPPASTVYWGNNGLLTGNWSAAGGSPNTIDTVENVFVQNPPDGTWTVEISADEVIEDGHVETAELDVDFALVVSGAIEDCNENGVSDSCDRENPAIEDCNANGIIDECELPPIGPGVAPGLPPLVEHQAKKNRYISIDATTNCTVSVALQVELASMKRCSGDDRRACIDHADCPNVCSGNHDLQCTSDTICINAGAGTCELTLPCVEHSDVGNVTLWVDEPFVGTCTPLEDCTDQWFAHLRADALYRVWTEDTLHITDCEIIPVADYEVSATADGIVFSDSLIIGTIEKPLVHYGDVAGPVESSEFTPPDGFVNVVDVQAFLIAMQAGATAPHTTWVDLHGAVVGSACIGGDCIVPQQIINVGDLQTIKFGFGGQTYVETPGHENPGACPDIIWGGGFAPGGGGPSMPLGGGTVLFTLVPSEGQIDSGQSVDVEVLIDSVDDLMAYEASLEVNGGTSGQLTLTDVDVDPQHASYVFASAPGVTKGGVVSRSLAFAAADAGVAVTGPGYLATFTYQSSIDASGTFQISVRPGQDILILNDSDGQPYDTDTGTGTTVEAIPECVTDPDCDDGNDCTIDTCVSYECSYENAAFGTSCDDGLFCTAIDRCNANGVCVGRGSPCPKFWWCDENNDTCHPM